MSSELSEPDWQSAVGSVLSEAYRIEEVAFQLTDEQLNRAPMGARSPHAGVLSSTDDDEPPASITTPSALHVHSNSLYEPDKERGSREIFTGATGKPQSLA